MSRTMSEWQRNERTKTPYFIHLRPGRPFGFADIWSIWRTEVGIRMATCAIVTCRPNEPMAQIHNRMPVIVPPEAREQWLEPRASEAELRALLSPLPAEVMEAYEVSTVVRDQHSSVVQNAT